MPVHAVFFFLTTFYTKSIRLSVSEWMKVEMRVIIHSCGLSCNVESCSAEAGSSRFMQMLHPSLFLPDMKKFRQPWRALAG